MTRSDREAFLTAVEATASLYFLARALENTPRGSREKTLREARHLFNAKQDARRGGISIQAVQQAVQVGRAVA